MKNFDELIKEATHFQAKEKLIEAKTLLLAAHKIKPGNKKVIKKISAIENKISLSNKAISKKDLIRIESLFQNSRHSEVVRIGSNLIKNYPYSIQVLTLMGASSHFLGNFEDAILCFNRIVHIDDHNHHAYNNLGNAFFELDRYQDALICYDNAIKINPNFSEVFFNVGNIFKNLHRFDEALKNYKKALEINPDHYKAIIFSGEVLAKLNRYEDALSFFNKAIDINSKDFSVYAKLGVIHSSFGNRKEAVKCYKKGLEINDSAYEIHRLLSLINSNNKDSLEIAMVDKLLLQRDIDDDSRSRLLSAKGNYENSRGNYSLAYSSFEESGILKQKIESYNFQKDLKFFEDIKEHSGNFFRNPIKQIDKLPFTPIFIVGMPRSGTSLLEQILSSHSKINGAGELPFMKYYSSKAATGKSELTQELLLRIRNTYINSVQNLTKSKSDFITDKMPVNFLYLGVILSAIPEAKIVHIERDPKAVCWSNFKTYFTDGLNYSFSIKDTVKYFHCYKDLMNLWNKNYTNRIYNIDYEVLVKNPVKEIPKLIRYLDITWEESCLYPEKNNRSVQTASSQQVRRKIYQGSSLDWENYRELIGEKFSSLP